MELYLPVAEMSVNWAVILVMGGAVGFCPDCSAWAAAS
jgi:hypothetical protein